MVKQKEPPSLYYGTKAPASAIPPKLTYKMSARFPRHHAYPMDNGWDPVGIYLDQVRSSRPQKAIHITAHRLDLTIQDSLWDCFAMLLFFLKGLFIKLMVILYALCRNLSRGNLSF